MFVASQIAARKEAATVKKAPTPVPEAPKARAKKTAPAVMDPDAESEMLTLDDQYEFIIKSHPKRKKIVMDYLQALINAALEEED